MKLLLSFSLAGLCATALFAQDAPSASKIFDKQIGNVEREVVSLAEAMPADKYNFAPTQGAFNGVRTFEQEVKHIAFTIFVVANAMLDQPAPEASGKAENGPDRIKGKDATVKYLKDAFAQAHKAAATLTNDNLMGETADPFDPKGKRTRVDSVGIFSWHTFDHYGQMVEYARMNNVIPPASR